MPQKAIPFLMMRGGTSRGLYFSRTDLPDNRDRLAQVLVAWRVRRAGHAGGHISG
ncbi:hypothetical protein DPM13_15040 [Paracoccus mutanolyticus]|uniref:4-oxalomesaconate tautomerase n=1 Tax=Paracoccus mutanolyticus TaxID=1499308 RepID=A0ABM6WTA8_9RHOB|nr:hypothetical protein DPM13_15040 [Paracoccus mutanolyticus]